MMIGTSDALVYFDRDAVSRAERKNDQLIDMRLLNAIGKLSNDDYAKALMAAIDDDNGI